MGYSPARYYCFFCRFLGQSLTIIPSENAPQGVWALLKCIAIRIGLNGAAVTPFLLICFLGIISSHCNASEIAWTQPRTGPKVAIIEYENPSALAYDVKQINPGCSCLQVNCSVPFHVAPHARGSITLAYDGLGIESISEKSIRVIIERPGAVEQEVDTVMVTLTNEVPCEMSPQAMIWSMKILAEHSQFSVRHQQVLVVPMPGFIIEGVDFPEEIRKRVEFSVDVRPTAAIIRAQVVQRGDQECISKGTITFLKNCEKFTREFVIAIVE